LTRVLVTGASGFVGRALVDRLAMEGSLSVRAALRKRLIAMPAGVEIVEIGSLGESADWSSAVQGVDVVVHCAARVHVMRESAALAETAYQRSNVEGTLALARAAAEAGCRRFVFLSSVKVNGEASGGGAPFRETDPPAPRDPYGRSKRDAERGLLALAESSGLEAVIIRPPLVYGRGVKANFNTLVRWVRKGVPFPFGAVDNRRSLVGIDNLVDLIILCMTHPAAANQIFLVSDGADVSIAQLIRKIAQTLEVPVRMLSVPIWLLSVLVRLVGRADLMQRLCGDLQVDISKARDLLGWTPPLSLEEGLARLTDAAAEPPNHA